MTSQSELAAVAPPAVILPVNQFFEFWISVVES